MTPLRARLFGRLLWVLLVAGCQRDCRYDEDDDDKDSGIEEDFYRPDSGRRDGGSYGDGDGDGDGPMDGGPMDGGPGGDGGPMDAGPGDASVPDANVDAEVLCPGTPPRPIGSASTPRAINVASLPFEGQVDWRGLAFMQITGLTPGQSYIVTLEGGADVTLLTYVGDTSFSTASCSDLAEPGYPAMCIVEAPGSSIHVAIDAGLESQTFQLDVIPMPDNESPSPNSPVAFALDSLPVTVSAVPSATSFYEITGLTAGQQYIVSARNTAEIIGLAVRASASAPQPLDLQTARDPQVVATTTGASLHVAVIAHARGTEVELSVKTSSYVAQGSKDAPVLATRATMPLLGQVPANPTVGGNPWERGRSYYAVTDLAPGTYVVSMTAEPGIALVVFGDTADFATTPLCGGLIAASGNTVECSAHITGSRLHFSAMNFGGDGSEARFELSDAPFRSEGLALDPIVHSMQQGALTGGVSATQGSYYRLSDMVPRKRYRFTVDEPLDSELNVSIYESGHADEPLCVFSTSSPLPECIVTAELGQLDLEVTALPSVITPRNVGTAFVLRAEELREQSVGTLASPLKLPCGKDQHQGEVGASGSTYYEVSGLTPGAAYIVELSSASGLYDLTVSASKGTWGSPCALGGPADSGRCKSLSSNDGKLFVRVHSDGLITFDLRVTAAMLGSEGNATNPFVIDRSATPYVGRASSAAPSYYKVTGLTPGKQYIVRLLSEQETTKLDVWTSGVFGGLSQLQLETLPGFPNQSVFYAHESAIYVTVALLPEADGTTNFSIELIPYD